MYPILFYLFIFFCSRDGEIFFRTIISFSTKNISASTPLSSNPQSGVGLSSPAHHLYHSWYKNNYSYLYLSSTSLFEFWTRVCYQSVQSATTNLTVRFLAPTSRREVCRVHQHSRSSKGYDNRTLVLTLKLLKPTQHRPSAHFHARCKKTLHALS